MRQCPEKPQPPPALHRRWLVLRKIVEARSVVALGLAGGVGTWGVQAYPVSQDVVFLGLIGERAPGLLSVLTSDTQLSGSRLRTMQPRC